MSLWGRCSRDCWASFSRPAAAIVLADFFGLSDTLGENALRDGDRPPAEYLYLDDERTEAYLGQIQNGLAPTETRTQRATRSRSVSLGVKDAVELGGNVAEEEGIESKVSPKAADRFYELESQLSRALKEDRSTATLTPVEGDELRELLSRPPPSQQTQAGLEEGDFVRIDNARLLLPTYTLALAKVAYARQFRSARQRARRRRVFPGALARFASVKRRQLRAYTSALGADPRVPFRLDLSRPKTDSGSPQAASVFLPVRYSKLLDAPSLLTGRVTIVGKVVRRAAVAERAYYDVETVVSYRRALEKVSPAVRRLLAVPRSELGETIGASATAESPALVVIPVAIYK